MHFDARQFRRQEEVGHRVILLHGFLSNPDDGLFKAACARFRHHDFLVDAPNVGVPDLRFSPLGQLRRIRDIVRGFSTTTAVHLVGHSLGGYLALCLANERLVSSLTLWEPSLHPRDIYRGYSESLLSSDYDIEKRPKFGLPPPKELENADLMPEIDDLTIAVAKPLLLIIAERGSGQSPAQPYQQNLGDRAEISVIRGANHNFDGSARTRLLELTAQWLIHRREMEVRDASQECP